MTDLAFTKGHGTENDFILLPDPDGAMKLGPEDVRLLAERRAGIGSDGVIRVVPTALASEPDVVAQSMVAAWFMDYRNADGSISQMCGNGVRVIAAYLRREGLEVGEEFAIATRSGVKQVRFEGTSWPWTWGHGPSRRRRWPERPGTTLSSTLTDMNHSAR